MKAQKKELLQQLPPSWKGQENYIMTYENKPYLELEQLKSELEFLADSINGIGHAYATEGTPPGNRIINYTYNASAQLNRIAQDLKRIMEECQGI